MTAYYNEHDPYAAKWLRNLIAAGHIAPGEVDERDIQDIRPDDIMGHTQCHFFAGLGGWSHALRLAGWPDDRPVWTGSCPCQPFSAAGKRAGVDDERHLWPHWFWLIRQRRPDVLFGEQVAAAIRHGWLDLVSADLESLGYAIGSVVAGAHSVGAPHLRQRLYFVAESLRESGERRAGSVPGTRAPERGEGVEHRHLPERFADGGENGAGELADADGRNTSAEWLQRGGEHGQQPQDGRAGPCVVSDATQQQRGRNGNAGPERRGEPSDSRELGDSTSAGLQGPGSEPSTAARRFCGRLAGLPMHPWAAADWLPCRDGKARPVEPGTFPLAHGVPARVGRLRAYGNAIVPQVAAEIVKSYLEVRS